ncbi:hypothetical protein KKF59_04155 [Patescibacteria group bacterium]|nr:hypothetical protein [Patescibacteria group bacterium]MBU1908286.1 hypothetical protein [Patescibacteria group bacterium]
MALNSLQQAQEYVSRAKNILIITRENATTDSVAASLAVYLYLKKMGKNADIVIPGFDLKNSPKFLPKLEEVKSKIGAMRACHVNLNVKNVPLGELMYDVKDGKLEITVVPKSGEWTPQDMSFKYGEDRYDLIISIDAQDMLSLGEISRGHADFLYRKTVLNVDCDAGNEHWGQVNVIDLNAVSTCEILYHLFEEWNRHLIDEDIATALLAGMIFKTKSFKTPNVTPKTLTVASTLVSMGARREEIVHGLWRTRTIPTLKLWGRALSRLEHDREHGLVWTVLTKNDLVETGSVNTGLDDMISELVAYAPEAKITVLFHETEDGKTLQASLHASNPYSALDLARPFGGSGNKSNVRFNLAGHTTTMEEVASTIMRLQETLSALKK